MNIDRLAQYYHNPAEMANHPLSELEELVQEYPFFTAGQLLLLKQYRIHNSSRYKKQHRKMLALAPQLAAQRGLLNGFKTSINTGKGGGQEVFHLHIHVYGTPV